MASHEDKVELKRGGRSKGKFDLHEQLGNKRTATVTTHQPLSHCHIGCQSPVKSSRFLGVPASSIGSIEFVLKLLSGRQWPVAIPYL